MPPTSSWTRARQQPVRPALEHYDAGPGVAGRAGPTDAVVVHGAPYAVAALGAVLQADAAAEYWISNILMPLT